MSFVLTNLPAIYPLIKGAVDRTITTYGSRSAGNITGGADKSGGNGYRLDSYPKGSRSAKNKVVGSSATQRIRHPWDSEEKIVEPTQSPASAMTGGLDDRSSQEDIHGSFTGECPGNKTTSQVMATGRWKRGSQPANMEHSSGIMVTKAYEYKVSEAS